MGAAAEYFAAMWKMSDTGLLYFERQQRLFVKWIRQAYLILKPSRSMDRNSYTNDWTFKHSHSYYMKASQCVHCTNTDLNVCVHAMEVLSVTKFMRAEIMRAVLLSQLSTVETVVVVVAAGPFGDFVDFNYQSISSCSNLRSAAVLMMGKLIERYKIPIGLNDFRAEKAKNSRPM